jgi:uncharacterized protein
VTRAADREATSRLFWRRWWATVVALIAAAAPLLVLLPLGGLWLWQQGWVLWWLLAAAVFGAGGYGAAMWVKRQAERAEAALVRAEQDAPAGPVSPPDADWSPWDLEAWDKVQQLARAADGNIVGDSELLLAAARETIDTVAAHYHEGMQDPIWRFTLPEALLLIERVSVRLRVVLLDNVPGAHLIRAGQLRRMWALKPAAETGMRVVGHVTNLYRLVRLVNPVGALLAEARGRLVGAALGETGQQLRRKGARIWIEEVGRAAIELYSGRLRVDAAELGRQAGGAPGLGVMAAAAPGPLRVLVAGQATVGKSSLVNALLGEVAAAVDVLPLGTDATRYALAGDAAPEAEIIDAPALDSTTLPRIIQLAREADCLVWVTAAHRADRATDRAALDDIRAFFAQDPRRTMPPLIAVMSHIDRLSPAREWQPPYDIAAPQRAKETTIRHALDAVAADLAMPPADIVPARLQPLESAYNVELIWALLASRFEAAKRGRALRLLGATPKRDWKRVLRQAGGAGKVLLRR